MLEQLQNKKKVQEDVSNTGFSFLSLFLFILIFFILLVTYAQVSEDNKAIEDVFKSFQGEEVFQSELLLVTPEQQRLIDARNYYQDLLSKVIPNNNILSQSEENFKDERVFTLSFYPNEIFDYGSSNLNSHGQAILKKVMEIQQYNHYYKLNVDIIFNLEVNDKLSIDRFRELMNFVIKFGGNHKLFSYEFAEGKDTKIQLDCLLEKI